MLRDSVSLIKDVHIINLTTEKGTFSNDYGQYRIVASLGDTIEFTSVQYETVRKTIRVFLFVFRIFRRNVIVIKINIRWH